jgi:hypothetical protein
LSLAQFTLYGTSACHLCELAEQLLQQVWQAGPSFECDVVDISESDELFERYGLVIPVLRHPDGRELNWPFAAAQLRAFLDS